jgi:serine protease
MRKTLLSLIANCAILLASATAHAQTQDTSAIADARVIVKYKSDSTLVRKEALSVNRDAASYAIERAGRAQSLGARIGRELRAGAGITERSEVVLASGTTSEELARRLSAESDIEYAVPDKRRHRTAAPNDALYLTGPPIAGSSGGPASGQWYLRAPSGEVQASVNAEVAWTVTTGSPSIVVAVLDTGVRFDHPDLLRVAGGGKLLPGYDMISDVSVANDGDGRDADPSDPGDWLTTAEVTNPRSPFYQCDTTSEPSSWHGTQTSGLIGALTNNGIGMASVGRNVLLLPVRVLGKCGGFDSDILAGMRWAAGLSVPGVPANPNPARVLNMSLGGEGACDAAYTETVAEINAAGAVVVAAAGNSTGHAVGSPANCPGVIAVGGLRHVGTKVGFSDLGPEIAVSAPAGNCVNTTVGTPCLYPILTTSNSGAMSPISDAAGGSIYTDAFNASLGTSFSAPLVAGTAALMLSVQPTLTPAQVRSILQATARPFPTTGGDNGDGTPVLQCTAPQYDMNGNPIDQLQCYCTTSTCGAGMLDAGQAVLAAQAASTPNYTGLFWNAPASSESGWGINFAHQGDVIFATWFTYDTTGKGWWLSMTATKTGANTYTGTLYQTSGPAFNAVPFNPAQVSLTAVGTGTLTFTDTNNGTFAYSVNGTQQVKTITRQVFGAVPTCVFGIQPDLTLATNYQDLWWNAPGGSESGWGVNFTHQGDTIFATWFTYDVDATPMWLSATLNKTGANTFTGTLFRSTGPPFSSVPFLPGNVVLTPVGSLTLTFANGNSATFAYTVNGVSQVKQITRQVFRAPGTICS